MLSCISAGTQDGSRALTPQLGPVSPTLNTKGVRALKQAEIIL